MQKQVSVITGGGGGFGKAIAVELGKSGPVVIADFNKDNLAYAEGMLKSLNIEVYTKFINVANEESCKELAEYAASIGEVKNVVNVAGVAPAAHNYKDDTLEGERPAFTSAKRMVDINAMGTIYMFEAFYPVLAEDSCYINWASSVAHLAPMENFAGVFDTWQEPGFDERLYKTFINPNDEEESYAMAGKAYMFTKTFVAYHTRANIDRMAKKRSRILSISPGMYDTANMDLGEDRKGEFEAQHPLGEMGRSSDMAAFIAFLCGPQARYINGRDYYLDGGKVHWNDTRQAQ